MSLQYLETALDSNNVKAFLMMIRHSEGTDAKDGYSYLFGSNPNNSRRFTDFSKHPDIKEPLGLHNFSSAAGAYQLLYNSWIAIKNKYNLPDFSPHSQDIAACELISERNVLKHVIDGNFDIALKACSNIWASLPFNSYGQPTHPISNYTNWYTQSGGIINNQV